MSDFWSNQQIASLKGKIYYWKRQITNGRSDDKAISSFNKYTAELEAAKAERPVKSKKVQPVVQPLIPPADFTVRFE